MIGTLLSSELSNPLFIALLILGIFRLHPIPSGMLIVFIVRLNSLSFRSTVGIHLRQ